MKEKADLVQKSDQNLLAKSSGRMLLTQNNPRKEHWRLFLVEIAALLLLPESHFGQALHPTATNHTVEGDFATVKNRTTEINNEQYGGKLNNK